MMASQQDASPVASSSKGLDDTSSSSSAPWYRTIRTHLSSHPPGSMWSTSSERSLLEPYAYLASRPGKEIRSKLIDAFNFWLQVPERRLRRVRKVVDMLHTASLLMDDVEDNSDLRRGLPVAHKVYGTPQVLNTANYVYFLVFKEVEAMGSEPGSGSSTPAESSLGAASSSSSSTSKATQSERLLVEEMINLHRGQGLDLLWRDTLTCPTEEEYVEMVRNKTGGLLRIAGGLMMIWSPLYPDAAPSPMSLSANEGKTDEEGRAGSPDLLPLLDLIGLLFQIRDDYMNLSAESYAQNKGFAEDLTEGKFSFPMIHGIRWSVGPGPAPNRQLLSILSSRPTDEHLKRYAVSYLRHVTGSFAYCREVMRELYRVIEIEVDRPMSGDCEAGVEHRESSIEV
ncbi:terpenoid synthase [Microstroma glucosiphilum]|uniref:(2E,6E)-farnesyl diphosphate synthase n=1 Tax=Pseudomicrostroma glucosiphilum TaxID=1684307 RepID=A0A316U9Y4_9BASI|nr:terpenoid synthase [Pseudomicrostroma glucosiphilum]PWN21969.1 terpenoid synthase [Pseudomicrostroma glucosiphilum]